MVTYSSRASASAMTFSDFYKGPRSPLSKLRQQSAQMSAPPTATITTTPEWLADEHSDLLSKDKTKQKEAVKHYLAIKVKNDWHFEWPSRLPMSQHANQAPLHVKPIVHYTQPQVILSTGAISSLQDAPLQSDDSKSEEDLDEQGDENSEDSESVYSIVSEDTVNFRYRMDWVSDLSDGEASLSSPFRFDSPETVGQAVQTSISEKRASRRRAVREEMAWNEGLACFEARRNAWTEARTVRVRNKHGLPMYVSPRSPRRFFFRRSISGSPPTSVGLIHLGEIGSSTASDTSSIAKDDKDLRKHSSRDSNPVPHNLLPVQTLLPLAHPILPPNNSLRASITPSVYLNLYDKIILNNLQPSCPINLSDMLRACVTGWKRDGEWPPRPSAPDPTPVSMRRKMAKKTSVGPHEAGSAATRRLSFGLRGRDKDDESRTGKGIRRSLQRAFGLSSLPGSPEDR